MVKHGKRRCNIGSFKHVLKYGYYEGEYYVDLESTDGLGRVELAKSPDEAKVLRKTSRRFESLLKRNNQRSKDIESGKKCLIERN